ncbi:NAD(P)H-binding protein [Eudoraea adriatica]|uniref:NAD(P)H-binding protein n=1 Tax=Eudoraea adriatica TaxID=446681 RepID=UPI000368DD4B|nr:NAD(P)H-binding protein [Eudoraea adriatica]
MKKEQNILVLGGKGKTGRRVANRLVKKGQTVRIGSRSENPSFDWEDPWTWKGALQGMESVYITFQPDLAVPGAKEAIEGFTNLAVESGIRKVVLLSGKGEQEAEECERIVMNSGLDWTIVRASWFNQNFSESFFLDPILAGHVALPKNEAQVPYVDANDIADVVVASLLDDKHNSEIYELTGPRTLAFSDVVREISAATGREIQFTPISMEEYNAMMKEFNLPDDYLWLINYLFEEVLVESNSMITNDIEKVLGREPIDFTTYANEVAKSHVWDGVGMERI